MCRWEGRRAGCAPHAPRRAEGRGPHLPTPARLTDLTPLSPDVQGGEAGRARRRRRAAAALMPGVSARALEEAADIFGNVDDLLEVGAVTKAVSRFGSVGGWLGAFRGAVGRCLLWNGWGGGRRRADARGIGPRARRGRRHLRQRGRPPRGGWLKSLLRGVGGWRLEVGGGWGRLGGVSSRSGWGCGLYGHGHGFGVLGSAGLPRPGGPPPLARTHTGASGEHCTPPPKTHAHTHHLTPPHAGVRRNSGAAPCAGCGRGRRRPGDRCAAVGDGWRRLHAVGPVEDGRLGNMGVVEEAQPSSP